MSHFSVMVRVTAERLARHEGDVKAAVAELLEPFDENSEDRRFVEFHDVEDEHREKYATETARRVRTPAGEIVSPYDERFRVKGTFGTTFSANPEHASHRVPTDHVEVDVPVRELYATFEQYVEDYCGYTKDAEKGRYGYWRNPQKKWDWWQIGGRWTGYFPVKPGAKPSLGDPGVMTPRAKPGESDIVRVSEIDFAKAEATALECATKFWDEWQRMLEGEEFPAFEGPRSRALDIGLLNVVRETLTEAQPGTRLISWEKFVRDPKDERRAWTDVAKLITRDEFFREYLCYFDELSTYAGLDDAGWFEPGRMGWFASSDATAASRREHVLGFRPRMIDACGPDDRLVAVDCHI